MIDPRTREPVPDPDQAYAAWQKHEMACPLCTDSAPCAESKRLAAIWDRADGLMAEANGQTLEVEPLSPEDE